jgi:hypothetical protein
MIARVNRPRKRLLVGTLIIVGSLAAMLGVTAAESEAGDGRWIALVVASVAGMCAGLVAGQLALRYPSLGPGGGITPRWTLLWCAVFTVPFWHLGHLAVVIFFGVIGAFLITSVISFRNWQP